MVDYGSIAPKFISREKAITLQNISFIQNQSNPLRKYLLVRNAYGQERVRSTVLPCTIACPLKSIKVVRNYLCVRRDRVAPTYLESKPLSTPLLSPVIALGN